MLTTLLPGLRELRAPLAAGYLWLLFAWIALEPRYDPRDRGLAATFDRLVDAISLVGLAVAASFTAYLVGSLSIRFLSAPMRRLFRTDTSLPPPRLNQLSSEAVGAVAQLVRESRKRMEVQLALSETNVDALLEGLFAEPAERPRWYDRIFSRLDAGRFVRRYRRKYEQGARLPADSPPSISPEVVTDSRLMRALVADLDIVLTARLLGKDTDLFSAIDRHRAEAEFRLAVIPPLVAVAVAVAWTTRLSIALVLLVAGLATGAALFWDALQRQRAGNDILVVALADGRVRSPTLERLEGRVSAIANEPRAQEMINAAREVGQSLRRAIELAGRMDSRPASVGSARRAVASARKSVEARREVLPQEVIERGAAALDTLETAVQTREQGVRDGQPAGWEDEAKVLIAVADSHAAAFRKAASTAIERLTAEGAARAAAQSELEEPPQQASPSTP